MQDILNNLSFRVYSFTDSYSVFGELHSCVYIISVKDILNNSFSFQYVGCTRNIKNRMASHTILPKILNKKNDNERIEIWAFSTGNIYQNRFLEKYFIKLLNPKYNIGSLNNKADNSLLNMEIKPENVFKLNG